MAESGVVIEIVVVSVDVAAVVVVVVDGRKWCHD